MHTESAALSISRMRRSAFQAAAALALVAAPATAQQSLDAEGLVYGLVGGGFGDGTFVATGAGAGLRLTPHLGLDVELTHLSGAAFSDMPTHGYGAFSVSVMSAAADPAMEDLASLPPGFDPWFPSVRIEDQRRDVTTFLTRFTVEFPVANGRLFPYLTGGGGVGRVTERFGIVVDPIPWIASDPLVPESVEHLPDGINTVRFFDSSIFPSPGEYSELGLSLVLGGGVDVRLWRGFGVGVDVRWLRILRSYDAFDTAQVASRVSYRF